FPQSKIFTNLLAGSYSVSELVPAGWALAGLTIIESGAQNSSSAGTTARLTLDPNENITVTFTDTQLGSIQVVKDAVPNDRQDFGFTFTAPGPPPTTTAFSLDDDADPTLPNARLFSGLLPGTYIITENPVTGWDLTGLGVAGASSTVSGGTARVTLA